MILIRQNLKSSIYFLRYQDTKETEIIPDNRKKNMSRPNTGRSRQPNVTMNPKWTGILKQGEFSNLYKILKYNHVLPRK